MPSAPATTFLDPQKLADQIEQRANEVFGSNELATLIRNNRKEATRSIKKMFGEQGERLDYKAAASGFPGRFDPGWVYDLVWFVPGEGKFEVAMAIESELDTTSVTNFDDDFLKLLDSTADVRVWLTCGANSQLAEQHATNYLEEARRFKRMIPGTVFIFIISEWLTGTTIIKRFTM
jgi:hypothetical protein